VDTIARYRSVRLSGVRKSARSATPDGYIEDTGARSIRYIYDFGDSWEHKLRIGKITDPVPGELYPRLTEISGRCPPEDVGGFPGYEQFLEAMADPRHRL
jgi:hypothetical protein